jgi:type I restriction enzyme S subunit
MAGDWQIVRLGDVVDLVTGFPFESQQYTNDPTAPRLLRGDNVGQGVLRWDGGKRWPADDSGELDNYRLREGDVILAMDRPWIEAGLKYAAVRDSDLPALLVQRVARLRGTAQLSTRFLKYVIGSRAFTEHVTAVQTGTAVPHISGGQIRSYEFLLPPLPEQRAIAHILGTLDDKIELNRRTNETLEAIARALFKSWFVDFDPVRAKSEGRDPGLPPHLADLFPASFEDSELGEIPSGWRVMAIADLADVNLRALDRTDRLEVIDYVEISEVTRGQVANVVRYERGTEPSRARRRLVHGDTVLSTVRPDRGSYFLSLSLSPPETLVVSTGFAVASPRDGNWAFLYSALTRPEVGDELGRLADGGAYPAVRPEAVTGFRLVSPQMGETRTAYDELARPLYERSEHNRIENRTLAGLRGALLPKLISGELRVKAVGRLVDAAVAK